MKHPKPQASAQEYNSQREMMKIPEYGRNIQKMIGYAMEIDDREKRNTLAQAIIAVMGQLNPHLRDVSDFNHKLWDHLFIISDFKLDVDSPYPKPSPESLEEKPEKLSYPHKNITYRHYGRNVELMIKKASEMEEGEGKQAFVTTIANLMKKFYLTWNRDSVADEVILNQLTEISNGELKVEGVQLIPTQDLVPKVAQQQFSGQKKKKKIGGKSRKGGSKQKY